MNSRNTASLLAVASLGLASLPGVRTARRFASTPRVRGNKYAGKNSLPPSAYDNTPRPARKSEPRSDFDLQDMLSLPERGRLLALAPTHKDGNRLANHKRKMLAGLVIQ
jgi:hypothetical protein